MTSVAYQYVNRGFLYFYTKALALAYTIISIFLGGSIYLINDALGYEVSGLVFINNGYSINLIILIFISPIILFLYKIKSSVVNGLSEIRVDSFIRFL